MKRTINTVLMLVIIITLVSTSSFAMSYEFCESDSDIKQKIAYMSLDDASPELQSVILQARKEIIFSKSWSADGFVVEIERADGTTETLPRFSDVFPGWELPVEQKLGQDSVQTPMEEPNSTQQIISAFHSVYLRNPTSQNTNPFTHFYHEGSYIKTFVHELDTESCNIGYSDYQSGMSCGHATEVHVGEAVKISTFYDGDYAVRASTFSSEGPGTFVVSHDTRSSI